MVLDDVADRTRRIVESPATLDPEVFRHRNLDALDLVAIPERLQERVRKAKEDHVVHGLFAQIMVDAEDGILIKGREQYPIEFLRRGPVMSERLFDDDAR